jgi:phage protein D
MPKADPTQPLVPGFAVLIDGEPLNEELRPYVTELAVDTDVRLPGMFELTLGGGESLETEVPWVDDRDLFDIGMKADIRFGYGTDVEPLLMAEIVSLEPHFALDRLPRLTVRGYDRSHRLQRARRTRTFLDQTDAEIASLVAEEAGLTPRVADTGVVHEYVLQANQTDLEFLQERASAVGHELFVLGEELVLRPAPEAEGEAMTLAMGQELLEFRPRVSSAGQPTETSVRGWDAAGKEAIVGRGRESDLSAAMDGTSRAPALVADAFGDAPWTLTDRPVFTSAEADAAAIANLGAAAGALVTGDATCWGRADLLAGILVRIEGVGERFGGRYYVTSATHRYTPQEGYQTRFQIRRNAS